jgi:hypothetical protein
MDLLEPFHRMKEDIISFELMYVVKNILDFVEVLPNISYAMYQFLWLCKALFQLAWIIAAGRFVW